MTTRIDVSCPPEQIVETRRVLAAAKEFDYGERVPVLPGLSERYQLDRRGVELGAYYESPEAQVYHQLQNFKWRAEHVLTDVLWDAGVTVAADFGHIGSYSNSALSGAMVHVKGRRKMRLVMFSPSEVDPSLGGNRTASSGAL